MKIRARIILKRTLDCEFFRIPSEVLGSLPNAHRTKTNRQLGVRYRINRTILHRKFRPRDSSIEMLWPIIHAPDVCNTYSILHTIHPSIYIFYLYDPLYASFFCLTPYSITQLHDMCLYRPVFFTV